ncbi:MAG: 3-deoxy-7-phosphoheptulonate synthase, partial [Planctomycetales bacterium]|nr:3-deoxy-7-phosphoheptulonate synthase [Planctomycetales bacterium]
MIIVLKPNSTSEQIDHIVESIVAMGLRTDVSRGIKRTVIGVIGEEDVLRNAPLLAIPGVEEVHPILKPYKLASREFQQEDSVIDCGHGVTVGGGALAMIAGPCAIEGEEILFDIARQVKAAGANILRGGAFKPRTSPYSFQGLGEEGLRILRRVGDELHMPVVTEVMDPRQVELIDRYTDMFQIGARNMQNFNLLSEVG